MGGRQTFGGKNKVENGRKLTFSLKDDNDVSMKRWKRVKQSCRCRSTCFLISAQPTSPSHHNYNNSTTEMYFSTQ